MSDHDRVKGILESIPPQIKSKLTIALLREIEMEGAGDRNLVLPRCMVDYQQRSTLVLFQLDQEC